MRGGLARARRIIRLCNWEPGPPVAQLEIYKGNYCIPAILYTCACPEAFLKSARSSSPVSLLPTDGRCCYSAPAHEMTGIGPFLQPSWCASLAAGEDNRGVCRGLSHQDRTLGMCVEGDHINVTVKRLAS